MIQITKTKQLDLLFTKWEQEIPGYKNHFVKDGIINEDLYEQTNPKVLFITKEPNNPNQHPGDFREWWKEEVKHGFSKRIAELSFGIINDFVQYDTVRKSRGPYSMKQTIQHIAFMNIKKTGGTGSSKYERILEHLKTNYQFIHHQIDIIDPEIIVLGLSWKEIRNELFPEIKWLNSGYDILIGRHKNSKVIDFYHPSSRNAPAAMYSLLQNVIQAPQFKNL
ncbi:MAG: hypothetical protein KDC09_15095 [Bacteroidales bacterium]|nr:hypothetical protein [Bacteroidales bacterium]